MPALHSRLAHFQASHVQLTMEGILRNGTRGGRTPLD